MTGPSACRKDSGRTIRPAGGTRLYALRQSPPAVTIFDVATSAEDAQVFWLPQHSQVSTSMPGRPVWEDPDHLLVLVGMGNFDLDLDADAVRLDVRTGAFERVPLAGPRAHLLVEPLLVAG